MEDRLSLILLTENTFELLTLLASMTSLTSLALLTSLMLLTSHIYSDLIIRSGLCITISIQVSHNTLGGSDTKSWSYMSRHYVHDTCMVDQLRNYISLIHDFKQELVWCASHKVVEADSHLGVCRGPYLIQLDV